MKKVYSLIAGFLLVLGLNAQEIPFEELPGVVRQDLLTEEEEFLDTEIADTIIINNEAGYYKGSQRSESTDTIIYYKWDRQQQEWRYVHRLIKTYNSEEQVLSCLLQHHSPQGEWINGVFKTYTYAGGQLSSVLVQLWHRPMQAWYNQLRKLYSYNDAGKLTEVVHQKWFFETQGWGNRFRKAISYNPQGNIASDTVFHWRPFLQAWAPEWMNSFIYDDQGFRTGKLTRHFMPDPGQWVDVHREIYHPDDAGRLHDIVAQHWDRYMMDWINIKKVVFNYNDACLVAVRLVKTWRPFEESWTDAFRSLYAYDANDNLDTLIFQHWREPAGMWANKELNDFEYDASGTLLSRLTQVWNPDQHAWTNARLMELVIDLKHLAAGTGNLAQGEKPGIRIYYPNPYNGDYPVTIAGEEGQDYQIKLTDLNGHVVFTAQTRSGEAFYLDGDMVPGLYFLMVSDGNKLLKSHKIVITR